MTTTVMNNRCHTSTEGYSDDYSPTNANDERSSFDSSFPSTMNGKDRHAHGSASSGSPNTTSGRYSENGSVRRDSCSSSDFYSEDDSDNSEDYGDATAGGGGGSGRLTSASQHSARQRHGTGQDASQDSDAGSSGGPRRKSVSSRISSSDRRNRSNSIGVNRMSRPDTPLSYFHRHSCSTFSLQNELRCYLGHLKHLYKTIEEDRLPWKTDFADLQKMRFPREFKEVAGRLNLNIPYYSSNYIEIFYVVTMPFLLVYNTPFFVVTLITMAMIHAVALRRKNTQIYGESVTVLGRPISYRNLAHVLLFAFAMLFMFFNGLKTLLWVMVLNLWVIVPHAVLRKPTYFDDEELEKLRPKLVQYGIVLLLLGLDYLEGDVRDNDDTMSRQLVEREKKRLAAVQEKREGKE